MPELPEVETTKQAIDIFLTNKKVEEIKIYKKKLRWIIPQKMSKELKNSILLKPYRIGKYILIPTNRNQTLLLHLGMSGRIKLENYLSKLEKHDHFRMVVSDEKNNFFMTYNDPRRFGVIDFFENNFTKEHFLLKKIGLDPFSKKFNKVYLLSRFSNKNISIKSALLDQKIVSGIGNIYACEILFLSKVHPLVIVKFLNILEIRKIITNTKYVLKNAIKAGGTSIKNFKNPVGKIGYFNQNLKVYGRQGKNCMICNSLISLIRINNRSTYMCEVCQNSPKKMLKTN